jgi:DNA-binding XRE family transcriptional regulator
VGSTDLLLKSISSELSLRPDSARRFGDLVLLTPPRMESSPALHSLFRRVVGDTPSFRWLPEDQLMEVFSSGEAAQDVFVGGSLDPHAKMLTLVRGNLETVVVPLSLFQPSGRTSPDFNKFCLDDFGHTIQFGDYEATADVVLWEVDADYRKRSKARERQQAEGFGASLRRLRIQRGLSQSDFPGVTRKTISRIENGEVGRPHGATLKSIANALGVAPEAVESY